MPRAQGTCGKAALHFSQLALLTPTICLPPIVRFLFVVVALSVLNTTLVNVLLGKMSYTVSLCASFFVHSAAG